MPELPEVNGLIEFLRAEAVGSVVVGVELASFSVLKTFDPPVTALPGLTITDVSRHGKFIDIDVDGIDIVVHLAKAVGCVGPTSCPTPGSSSARATSLPASVLIAATARQSAST